MRKFILIATLMLMCWGAHAICPAASPEDSHAWWAQNCGLLPKSAEGSETVDEVGESFETCQQAAAVMSVASWAGGVGTMIVAQAARKFWEEKGCSEIDFADIETDGPTEALLERAMQEYFRCQQGPPSSSDSCRTWEMAVDPSMVGHEVLQNP